jgi:hypothetical protein
MLEQYSSLRKVPENSQGYLSFQDKLYWEKVKQIMYILDGLCLQSGDALLREVTRQLDASTKYRFPDDDEPLAVNL